MIRERITQEELILYEIIRHPVLCGEFLANVDATEFDEVFEFHIYQRDMLCDFNERVVFSCARAIGKTIVLSWVILWVMVNNIYPENYIVYTVPNKSHLEPVFTNLSRLLRVNSFLRNYIEPRKGINGSSYTITLLNQKQLICRIAGQSGDGRSVVGLHSPLIIADELGYYPWGTWLELQPTVNTWEEGYRVIGSGVPTGLREKNVLYHLDQENSNYTKHRISAYDNPRFSKKDEELAIEQYGGKDSEDYIHFVLGQHGAPVFSVFDRSLLKIESYPVYKLVLDGTNITDVTEYIEKLKIFPELPPEASACFIGIDLGYTDPTAIFIMYLDKKGMVRFHGKMRLNKVAYPIQIPFIDMLDTKFSPSIIGIDEGHAGLSVTQKLKMDTSYAHKDYHKRMYPVSFGSWLSMGYDSDGNELKVKMKPFSVSLLQSYSNNHKIIYSHSDSETITELERMTYNKTVTGEIVYRTLTPGGGKKGEDHFTAALLCAVVAYYQENELELYQARKKNILFSKARWF